MTSVFFLNEKGKPFLLPQIVLLCMGKLQILKHSLEINIKQSITLKSSFFKILYINLYRISWHVVNLN